jgi:hypothetical protein
MRLTEIANGASFRTVPPRSEPEGGASTGRSEPGHDEHTEQHPFHWDALSSNS